MEGDEPFSPDLFALPSYSHRAPRADAHVTEATAILSVGHFL